MSLELAIVYLIGAGLYAGTELLWRGWTHWTMLLCGGLCFMLMYLIGGTALPLWQRCVLCCAVISTVELLTGCVVNIILGWRVWDYSAEAFDLFGQICPLYCFYWLLLSVPGLGLCSVLRRVTSRLKL